MPGLLYFAILIDKLSGRYDRSPRLLLRQVRASAEVRDVITLTEVAGWRRRRVLRKVPGFTVLQDTKHGDMAEVAVLVRDSAYRVKHWAAHVIGPDLGPGGRVIALVAVLEHIETGKIVIVGEAHTPATVEGQWTSARAAAYRRAVQAYRAIVEHLRVAWGADVVVVLADWNLNLHRDGVRAYLKEAWPELNAPAKADTPPGGTHAGGRLIDFPLVTGAQIDTFRIHAADPASDHRGISVTLHAPVKPPKKETTVLTTSQNHWPALERSGNKLHTWVIPAKNGAISLVLRNGSAGFILAYVALRIAETVAALFGKTADDWGYAYRPVRGYSTTLSNHSSGTAMDLNATQHPLGKVGTWTAKQAMRIHLILAFKPLGKVVRWGGDYHGRKDEMHFEIVADLTTCERVAKALAKTPRGKRLLAVNPGQWEVICS